MMTPEKIAAAYRFACMAELEALKPGNVHIFSDGHGMQIGDFIVSAEVSAVAIAAPKLTVGERILSAVQATQKAVGLNTNLGIILLCAPIIQAALQLKSEANFNLDKLQIALNDVLQHLSVNDAQCAASAIVLANPAGLGEVSTHDVHHQPQVSLMALMQAAESHDRIAWQYTHQFSDIFDYGLARYQAGLQRWQHFNNKGQHQAWATTALYLGFLARQPDTHIIRKHGRALANDVMLHAQTLAQTYWQTDNPKLRQSALLAWDTALKNKKLNPGTSADLTVATLMVHSLIN